MALFGLNVVVGLAALCFLWAPQQPGAQLTVTSLGEQTQTLVSLSRVSPSGDFVLARTVARSGEGQSQLSVLRSDALSDIGQRPLIELLNTEAIARLPLSNPVLQALELDDGRFALVVQLEQSGSNSDEDRPVLVHVLWDLEGDAETSRLGNDYLWTDPAGHIIEDDDVDWLPHDYEPLMPCAQIAGDLVVLAVHEGDTDVLYLADWRTGAFRYRGELRDSPVGTLWTSPWPGFIYYRRSIEDTFTLSCDGDGQCGPGMRLHPRSGAFRGDMALDPERRLLAHCRSIDSAQFVMMWALSGDERRYLGAFDQPDGCDDLFAVAADLLLLRGNQGWSTVQLQVLNQGLLQ